MKVLILGNGQIGQAMEAILSPYHKVTVKDTEDLQLSGVEIMHVCYPDSIYFLTETQAYMEQYRPKLTIIHSSVSPGKTAACGSHVVNCPVRGRHPNLAKEIPAFPLFIGGESREDVALAVEYLSGCNLVCADAGDPQGTELVKLLSNVHMGLEIAWRQEVKRMLDRFGVDPLVYERWEDSYKEGYRITDNEQLTRPRLRPDPIGGHCILECTDILSKRFESKIFDFIRESNETERTKTNGHARETVSA